MFFIFDRFYNPDFATGLYYIMHYCACFIKVKTFGSKNPLMIGAFKFISKKGEG